MFRTRAGCQVSCKFRKPNRSEKQQRPGAACAQCTLSSLSHHAAMLPIYPTIDGFAFPRAPCRPPLTNSTTLTYIYLKRCVTGSAVPCSGGSGTCVPPLALYGVPDWVPLPHILPAHANPEGNTQIGLVPSTPNPSYPGRRRLQTSLPQTFFF